MAIRADGELSLPDVGESPSQPINIRITGTTQSFNDSALLQGVYR